ncbi:MAG TPA: phage tail sheath family protein [Alphaproteobacteria bacterium]|nr:phage tail sheath family protein [Alphaproteobacteria bacterium]
MSVFLRPGVYVQEIERGPRPMEGVSTSTATFLGETQRGPVWPTLVTSINEYVRIFGGPVGRNKFMPAAVSGFFENGGRRVYIARIENQASATASDIFGSVKIEASSSGKWGTDNLFVKISARNPVVNPIDPFRIQVWNWSVAPNPVFDPSIPANALNPKRPSFIEDFDSVNCDPTSPDYFVTRLRASQFLKGTDLTAVAAPIAFAPPQPGAQALPGGTSVPVTDNDYDGQFLPAGPSGLAALQLDEFRFVSLVYAPDASGVVQDKVLTHCENNRFRFAVIDAAKHDPASNVGGKKPRSSDYGAFYFPWIKTNNSITGVQELVPPGGHVVGIYARSDSERGVFKAPANEIVRGAFDIEFNIDDATHDVLNPLGVNVIRKFPGRGNVLWGARTLSSNSLWRYISVRRLFIFLEQSIYENTQWVVFEPNDERLWARVKDTIRIFLRSQWRQGAMMGDTEDKAFTIACDRTTMTQDDILNGRLICEIGIAPVRPAEFVVFRIFQNTSESQK